MDYKQTVFLPKTEFPMRGGLPKKEPEIMAHWEKLDLAISSSREGLNEASFGMLNLESYHVSLTLPPKSIPGCRAGAATLSASHSQRLLNLFMPFQ